MAISKRRLLQNFLSSGWRFSDDEYLLKQRFYLLNIVVALGFFAVGQGILYDWYYARYTVLVTDIAVFLFFTGGILYLRKKREALDIVTSLSALISLLYLDFLMLISKFEDMEFVWLFFFVVTFMFLKGPKVGALWNLALFTSLLVLKIQTLYPIDFTYTQIFYLIFALLLVSAITYSFHKVIDENYQLIFKQRRQLKAFNSALESKVLEQTNELRVLNESLSETVANKVAEVHEKQEMLITQSRFAAMGEMLSMIAHQWRQPLATTTLRISNMQINAIMNNRPKDDRDELLVSVSDTLVYLSDTIDDFQTYFKPDNKNESADIRDLVERACNFVKARTDIYAIEVSCQGKEQLLIETLPNELIQVVINILNNAIDVLASLEKRDKKIEIIIDEHDGDAMLYIRDSGKGIPEALLTRIFEPYFSTKSKNGTGLGLYMAKIIVQEHMKGKIYAINGEKGGAEFCIQLPIKS